MTSIVPRIKEFPISLNVGAVTNVKKMLWWEMNARTFFDISSEIDDLPSNRRNEKIGDRFL